MTLSERPLVSQARVINFFLLVGWFVFGSPSVNAQQSSRSEKTLTKVTESRDFLRGLKAFDVRVNIDHRDSTLVRTTIELKLRQNGIVVSASVPSFLIFDCSNLELRAPADVVVYTCDILVRVYAVRPSPTMLGGYVTVWTAGGLGKVGTETLGQSLLAEAGRRTDEFLNAWYAVNIR